MLSVDHMDLSSPLLNNSIFIPPKEVLSIFPGFALAIENKDFDFDETYLDISKKLAGVPLKGRKLSECKDLCKELAAIIGGDISLENNIFYLRSSGKKIEAQLIAEGSRKLAILLYLLKTGELTEGCTVFWDEPEANLNPIFLIKLAQVLTTLSHTIQIFVATHSLFLLREIDILKTTDKNLKTRFFSLIIDNKNNNVNIECGDSIDDINTIAVLDEAILQSQRYQESQYKE